MGLALLAALTALGLGSCATSSPQSRIASNPGIYERLEPEQRQQVASGVIREGMTQDAVFLAWGRPDKVAQGSRLQKNFEEWTYVEYETVRRSTIGIGIGYGGYRGYGRGCHGYGYDPFLYGGPAFDRVPVEAAKVTFINGRVTEWKILR